MHCVSYKTQMLGKIRSWRDQLFQFSHLFFNFLKGCIGPKVNDQIKTPLLNWELNPHSNDDCPKEYAIGKTA